MQDAATTALTEEGYQTVLSSNSTDQVLRFHVTVRWNGGKAAGCYLHQA